MNTNPVAHVPAAVPVSSMDVHGLSETGVCLREATAEDAPAIHALVAGHLAEGHLLPRALDEVAAHASRFLVATHAGRLVACGELAPLSRSVAEVRSLVVGRDARRLGVGADIIERLVRRATAHGFEKLCAFTHRPSYFVRHGFSIVPHVWLAEKIVTDCHRCPLFRRCGQYAVVRPLARARVLHG
ncbi:MAG: GNAT family N-acetyltransferase [Acidobacteria bacterium]|nr:GNAT family N-acetyltransferase [Acidobacteriota bacterium]